ncbi:MAG: polysaccharide deacetylase family protein [Candidatus Pacebacteria bacterium]|nr:polysaccharide deacetylase family protein [Candidatus Paceibacterota bacterium]
MKKRIQFGLALITFMAIYTVAILLVLRSNQHNSFEITRKNNDPRLDNQKQEEKAGSASGLNNQAKREIDLDWAIEKYSGKEISRVDTTQKVVALTFDAGANADGVEPILKILAENNIRGTFFLTGKFIEKYPEKVRYIISSGGEIGNHSYDHPYLTQLTDEEITGKIQGAENALAELDAGFQPFFRSPYGDRNQSTLETISENGYINIRWTIDSLGWMGTSGEMNKNSVKERVVSKAAPGAIIMMHLGSNPTDKTHLDSEALPEIISELKADGYEFITMSELLELMKGK